MRAAVLVFPPHWYYASVPADLLYTGSHLRAQGVPVRCLDLSADLSATLLGEVPGYQALRQAATYTSAAAYAQACASVDAACQRVAEAYGVGYDFYALRFPDLDEGHVPSALRAGLDPSKNPALPLLRARVADILRDDPALVAVALGHPDQLLQVVTLGRLLRQAGYGGFLCLYGSHEDVVTPEDLLDDLLPDAGPPHALFDDYDGVVIGEAESALLALCQALAGRRSRASVPALLCPAWGLRGRPGRGREDLAALAPADFTLVDPAIYPFPTPMPDLRLSRGCPWSRCTFCAITAHQAGYRSRPPQAIADEMAAAYRLLGARHFRLRDDLLTPRQLRELAAVLPTLPFQPRWCARARFEPNLTAAVLQAARAAGLEELWLGLESASAAVRERMVKGAQAVVIERVLRDADEAGIRVRALCMVGYPGERRDEVQATFDFLQRHQFRLVSAALTPFQLMRNTPLYRDPARHGLLPVPDPTPRRERLRFQGVALSLSPDTLTQAEAQELVEAGARQLSGWLAGGHEGPTLAHAWLRASLTRLN